MKVNINNLNVAKKLVIKVCLFDYRPHTIFNINGQKVLFKVHQQNKLKLSSKSFEKRSLQEFVQNMFSLTGLSIYSFYLNFQLKLLKLVS